MVRHGMIELVRVRYGVVELDREVWCGLQRNWLHGWELLAIKCGRNGGGRDVRG